MRINLTLSKNSLPHVLGHPSTGGSTTICNVFEQSCTDSDLGTTDVTLKEMCSINKKLSYRKQTVRLLHNIEIRVLH